MGRLLCAGLLAALWGCGGLITAPTPEPEPTATVPAPVPTPPAAGLVCTQETVGQTVCGPEPLVCQYVFFEDGSYGFKHQPCYEWDTWCSELVWQACK